MVNIRKVNYIEGSVHEGYMVFDGEPMQLFEGGGDVLLGLGLGENPGSWILHKLMPVQSFIGPQWRMALQQSRREVIRYV